MIREYEDKRIYKNLKTVKILSIISLVLSILAVITLWVIFSMKKFLVRPNYETSFYFYLVSMSVCVVCIPVSLLTQSSASLKQKNKAKPVVSKDAYIKQEYRQEDKVVEWGKRVVKESKRINDFTNTLSTALMPLFFWGVFLVACLCIFGLGLWAFLLGYMLLPQLLYIPNIILLRNCVLIKREWKKNPPLWYAQDKLEKEAQERVHKEKQQQAECEQLLSRVGKRFFVELYPQLRDWDELDILDKIRGEYGEETAKKRIVYGKEIFKKGLEKYALQIICDLSDDKIDGETKRKAEELIETFGSAEENNGNL